MIEMFRNNTMSFLLKVDTQGIEEMLKYNEKNPKDKFDWSIMESVSMCLPEKTAK